MNNITELSRLIGIQLEDDEYADKPNLNGVIIGTILCQPSAVYVDQFRRQLQSRTFVPTSFRFFTTNGWPIDRIDEGSIEVSKLVCSGGVVKIQKYFDLPRLGIKWPDGKHLGFIFINYNKHLTDVREKILLDLGDIFVQEETDFEFLEQHEWPVAHTQEKELEVWDICLKNYCVINKVHNKVKPEVLNKVRKTYLKLSDKETSRKQNSNINSVMISYVHEEATAHARNLKIELLNMGIDSVFLDVDDIPAGKDWQDVINTALTNCNTFVALVTPKYGETRWTNREAKLADDKEKLIIPISFLEKWPPHQLAVQFLSLQYIPWKTKEELSNAEDGVSMNITSWDPSCVHRVAKEIKKLCTELEVPTPNSLTMLDVETVPKTLNKEEFNVPLSIDMAHQNEGVVDISCDDVLLKNLSNKEFNVPLSIDLAHQNQSEVDISRDDALLRDWSNKCDDTKKKYFSLCSNKTQSSNEEKPWIKFHVTLDKIPTWKNHTAEFQKNVRLNEKVSIYVGDITTLVIDAIVNATDTVLSGSGGVDRAIHRAAGRELYYKCRTLDHLNTGEAKITDGYNLPAKYVIHTAGPIGLERHLLEGCYKNSLFLALERGVKSIAFPCISTGCFEYPHYEAAHVALRTVRRWLELNEPSVDRIVFCLFLPVDVEIYGTLMNVYFPI